MYAQPSFLNKPDAEKRQFLQLLGFMRDTYWHATQEVLGIPLFQLPEMTIDGSEISTLIVEDYLRLGHRLERFFSWLINHSFRYEIIAENIQIIAQKITLGELDFIIKDLQTQDILHVELAGKLYLYDPNISEESKRWIGPNRRDTLEKKLFKLKEHQFPLLFHPETKKYLETYKLSSDQITQKMCLKIRQFLPWQMKDLPPYAFPENVIGYYVNIKTFEDIYFKPFQYFMPEKQDWIVEPEYGEVWFDYNQILPQIQGMHQRQQSPLLWLKKNDATYETFFVTFW